MKPQQILSCPFCQRGFNISRYHGGNWATRKPHEKDSRRHPTCLHCGNQRQVDRVPSEGPWKWEAREISPGSFAYVPVPTSAAKVTP